MRLEGEQVPYVDRQLALVQWRGIRRSVADGRTDTLDCCSIVELL